MSAFQRDDDASAVKLLRPFSEQGDPAAQVAMATMFLRGTAVQQSNKIAAQWALKAARQWHPGGCFLLGVIAIGENKSKEAYLCLYTAAMLSMEQGNPAAADEPKRMMGVLAKSLSANDVADAQRMATQSLSARRR